MKKKMNSRERVLAALRREEPDRVPYCELGVDPALARKLMGWGGPITQARNIEANDYRVEEAKAIAARLHLDNIFYVLRAPVYAQKHPGKADDVHGQQGPDPCLRAGQRAPCPGSGKKEPCPLHGRKEQVPPTPRISRIAGGGGLESPHSSAWHRQS